MRYKIPALIILCCLFFCGCEQKESQSQIRFYYCTSNVDYKNGMIGSEVCNNTVDPLAYDKLFSTYLSGPRSKELQSPFPGGTSLISIVLQDQTARIVLSDNFAELTGIRLSIACACISLTVKELTGCATVEISTPNALLDNQQTITIDTNAIALNDHVHP